MLRSPHANARADVDRPGGRPRRARRALRRSTPATSPDYDGGAVLTAEPGTPAPRWPRSPPRRPRRPSAALVALAAAVGGARRSSSTWTPASRPSTSSREPSEYERGDVEAALEGAPTSSRPSTARRPSCTTSWSRTAPWPSGGGDGLTVWSSTQGDLRRPRRAGRRVRAGARPGAGDVRVHGRRVRRRRSACGTEGDLAAELARRSGRPVRLVLVAPRGEPDGRLPDRARAELSAGRRRGRHADAASRPRR